MIVRCALVHFIDECDAQRYAHIDNTHEEYEKAPLIRLRDFSRSQHDVADKQISQSPYNVY